MLSYSSRRKTDMPIQTPDIKIIWGHLSSFESVFFMKMKGPDCVLLEGICAAGTAQNERPGGMA